MMTIHATRDGRVTVALTNEVRIEHPPVKPMDLAKLAASRASTPPYEAGHD